MGIDRQIVEKQVGQAVPRQMAGYLHLRREYQTRRIDAAGLGFAAQVAHGGVARLQQPQYAAFDLPQQPHPYVEQLRRELVAVVEATEHEPILGQPDRLS